jgi:serine/threonine protein kinase
MHSSHSNIDYKSNYIGEYIINQTLGTGTFSKVKLGINKYTKEKVAIKLLDKNKITEKSDLERIFREMSIVKTLNHPNIVKTHEIFDNEKYYFMIMDYCPGGELFDYIVNKIRLNEEESSFFFYQIINAVEYIHSKGIVHRDLKPENLLLNDKNKLKIIDFGLSNYFFPDSEKNLLKTPCGSPCYAAPEMVSGNNYNGFKTDIWAIGIILYAMLVGYLPFEDNDNDILFQKILECDLEFPDFLSNLSIDIITKILNVDSDKRYTIQDIKKHMFYLNGKKVYQNVFGNEINDNLINNEKLIFNRKISTENLIGKKNRKSELGNYLNIGYKSNRHFIKKIENNSSVNEKNNIKLIFTDFSNYQSKRNNKIEKIPKISFNSQMGYQNENKENIKINNLFIRNNSKRGVVNKIISNNNEKENRLFSEGKNTRNLKLLNKERLNHFKISILNKDKKKIFLKSEYKYNNKIDPSNSPITIHNAKNSQSPNRIYNKIFMNQKYFINGLPLITQDKNIKNSSSRKYPLKTDSNLNEPPQINSTRLKEISNKFKMPFNIHNIATNKYKKISIKGIK